MDFPVCLTTTTNCLLSTNSHICVGGSIESITPPPPTHGVAYDKIRFLEGPAKATIAGLSLTGASYKCAVDLLKKRFEKKNEVQRAHINELIHLSVVYRERDTHRLRTLYDRCEAHNRKLRALGVSEDSNSTIVVPTIMEKLPLQFRLAITRGANFLEWSVKEMLEAYEKELELREAHYPVGFNHTEKDLERDSGKKYGLQGSAAALLASEKKNCALSFCLKNHAHEKCDAEVDPKTRKNIARKYGRCFLCLFKGHRASNYSVKAKCKNCNGSHHIALYETSSKDDNKMHDEKVTETEMSRNKLTLMFTSLALETAICIWELVAWLPCLACGIPI